MQIFLCENQSETYKALTESMLSVMKHNSERDFFMAISGGNTPLKLFEFWAHQYIHLIDWKHIQLFWVDERCVSPSDIESNYRMTVLHLLREVPFIEKHIHRIKGELLPEIEARRYSDIIKRLLPWENDLPVFDLILLGIGDDGHTASIFPGETLKNSLGNINSKDDIYFVTEKPSNHQKRISMSLQLINNARNIYFLITGSGKERVLSQIYLKTKQSYNYPAAYINPKDGKLISFICQDAIANICLFRE